jgi:hypothetical protein
MLVVLVPEDGTVTSKDKDGMLKIREQEFHDPVTGAYFKFVILPGTSAPARIYFRLSHNSWREYCFDELGELSRATTKTTKPPQSPGRLRVVK